MKVQIKLVNAPDIFELFISDRDERPNEEPSEANVNLTQEQIVAVRDGINQWLEERKQLDKRENQIRKAIRRSHELQFGGMDYQAAMWEVGQEIWPMPDHDEIMRIESSPEPYCECGFCRTADWKAQADLWD